MTKLLSEVMEAASRLPADEQDQIAQAILGLLKVADEPQALPDGDRAAVLEGLAQVRRGEYATDEEVEEAFARFRR